MLTGRIMPKTKLWIMICMVLIAAGCTLPRFPGDSISKAPKPTPNKDYATVYLYRYGKNTPIKTGIVRMYVDNNLAFKAADSSFTWILVKPGLHEIKTSWTWDTKPLLAGGYFDNDDKNLSINFEAGETYYINYRTTEGYDSMGRFKNILIVKAELENTKSYVALSEMENCGYLSNSYKP